MCRIYNLRVEPFTKYSAEEELEVIDKLFYRPAFYNELVNLLGQGNSRFIIGQRGQGKSMIIHKLLNDLRKNNSLTVLLTRYDDIPLVDNETHFLYKIAELITHELLKSFASDYKLYKRLSDNQKKKFNVLVEMFYNSTWAPDYVEQANVIKHKKKWIWFQKFFNRNLSTINKIAESGLVVTAELLRSSFLGSHHPISKENFANLFNELSLSTFVVRDIKDIEAMQQTEFIIILKTLVDIVLTVGFSSLCILFDKIDEYNRLESDVDKISDFMQGILSDTDLLYTNKLGIVCTLWSEAKKSLNARNVRFDKFKDIDISWTNDQLEKLIDHRLDYYTHNHNLPVTLAKLIPDRNLRNEILSLANHSPRTLIRILNDIYYAHEDDGNKIRHFDNSAIIFGLKRFCETFDFLSIISVKPSKKIEFPIWLRKLLTVKTESFTIADYQQSIGVKATQAKNHIKEFLDLGLIRITNPDSDDEVLRFEILDPRLRYMIRRGITLPQ